MPRFELTVEIARSPEDVFAYLTEVSKLPDWQSSATAVEADGTVQLETRIRERRAFLGRDVRTELEVTAYDPPQRFDVTSRSGPVPFSIHHALERTADGTRLQVAVDVTLGPMLRIAAQGPPKLAEREFRADFERLRRILDCEQ